MTCRVVVGTDRHHERDREARNSTGLERKCQFCDHVGHSSDNCVLFSTWESGDSDTPSDSSGSDDTKTIELGDDYRRLAGKLNKLCRNLVPDYGNPPSSSYTMMKHVLQSISTDAKNIDVVSDHVFGGRFDREWLCLKAMCDRWWKGPIHLTGGECTYCNRCQEELGPVTLCYQIKPMLNQVSIYREIAVLRANRDSHEERNSRH